MIQHWTSCRRPPRRHPQTLICSLLRIRGLTLKELLELCPMRQLPPLLTTKTASRHSIEQIMAAGQQSQVQIKSNMRELSQAIDNPCLQIGRQPTRMASAMASLTITTCSARLSLSTRAICQQVPKLLASWSPITLEESLGREPTLLSDCALINEIRKSMR